MIIEQIIEVEKTTKEIKGKKKCRTERKQESRKGVKKERRKQGNKDRRKSK